MLELTLRLVASLAVVVGLLLLLARFGARRFSGRAGAMVHVVHRQALSRTSSVTVVTVGSRVLVLGTTEQQISVLTELDPEELHLDELDALVGEVSPGAAEGTVPVATGPTLVPTRLLADGPIPSTTTTASPSHGGTHRASSTTTSNLASGPLAGSVLSPQTWRQAFRSVQRTPGRRAS